MSNQKVKREQLMHALELVSPGLSAREVVDQANMFCFKDKKVFTFDDEIAAIMDSPLDIEGAIHAEPLKAILTKLREEYLEMSQEEGHLSIKGKGQWIKINMEKKIELPIENLEIPKKWKKLPEEFSKALQLVVKCAGRDESQFELTCVHLTKDWLQAFDTLQFARFKLDMDLKKDTLVREVSIKHLVNLEMQEFAETEHWLHFKNSAGLIFACRRFTDQYPSLDHIAAMKGKKISLPKRLIDTADSAQVFSIKNEHENYIRVDLRPGWIVVKGEGVHGSYKGRRKIKYTGRPLAFLIHPEMLMQLVKDHSECELCMADKGLKASIGNFMFITSLSEPNEVEQQTEPVAETNGAVIKKKKVKQ